MSKTLAYLGGAAACTVAGAIGYKRVAAIRKGVDTAHDVAISGVTKAFSSLKRIGEAGTKAVEAHEKAHEQKSKKTITVGGLK